jgi:serine/threonine protein kinase
MPLAQGTKLGPYEILAPVGTGGMGEVYRARDTRLERTVAIKILPSEALRTADMLQRFEREAKAISALQHPNICVLHDIGHQDGTDYLVMEYLEGETLAERLQRGPLPPEQVLKLGMELADALDKAHRKGVVHRDIKPANVILTKTGCKLLDFGLAKPMASVMAAASGAAGAQGKPLTQEGTIVGTYQYMAPEQIEGGVADARTDIFALGALLYEAATGRLAFPGKSQTSVIASILSADPPPMRSLQPAIPPELERLVRDCLAKDPDDRVQSAHDAELQLQWILEGPPAAGHRGYVAAAWRWIAVTAMVAALAAMGALAYLLVVKK